MIQSHYEGTSCSWWYNRTMKVPAVADDTIALWTMVYDTRSRNLEVSNSFFPIGLNRFGDSYGSCWRCGPSSTRGALELHIHYQDIIGRMDDWTIWVVLVPEKNGGWKNNIMVGEHGWVLSQWLGKYWRTQEEMNFLQAQDLPWCNYYEVSGL